MDTNEKKEESINKQDDNTIPAIHDFLSRHIPSQVSNSRKLCYRHRPDLIKRRMPDTFDFKQVQLQMEELNNNDRAAITHIWSLFSAAPADQRTLILKGLLSTCCMPQLSFLFDEIKPLLRIDFVSILPREVSLQIFSYMDAKSLCHAAQVSQTWRSLADDDALWHRMCEQHIDKKCTKCGWGLPLLDKKKQLVRKRSITTAFPSTQQQQQQQSINNHNHISNTDSPLRTPSSSSSFDSFTNNDKSLSSSSSSSSSSTTINTSPVIVRRRPWKEVYSERLMVERNWRKNKYTVRVLSGHTDGVMCVQFCDASNLIMTGSYDKTIKIWNLETGELIRTLEGHTRCVRALQFDEAKLVTGAMDNTVKIWNWHTGQCIRTLEGHTGGVLSLHFDCRLMVSGSTDHTIRVWNFQAGECCTLTGHTEWVNSVRLYQKDMLISGSDDSTIRLWNVQTRTCLREFKGHVGQVQIALPSPKGFTHRLLDEEVAINSNQRVVPSNEFRPGCETSLSPSSSHLHSNNNNLRQHQHHKQSKTDKSNASNAPSLSDVPIVMSGSLDNTVKQWNLNTGVCLRTLFGHVEGVWGLAYDTLRIVSGSHDKTIRVWDMDSGKCMHALEGHRGAVTSIALSDTKIVSTSDDGDVRIWDYGVH
ncbi:WD40-repeat-containing domain protein [Cunninghamella echinulata]|nr:WD40-repeat-containing domain protein [Cunninghamella echinulata]